MWSLIVELRDLRQLRHCDSRKQPFDHPSKRRLNGLRNAYSIMVVTGLCLIRLHLESPYMKGFWLQIMQSRFSAWIPPSKRSPKSPRTRKAHDESLNYSNAFLHVRLGIHFSSHRYFDQAQHGNKNILLISTRRFPLGYELRSPIHGSF